MLCQDRCGYCTFAQPPAGAVVVRDECKVGAVGVHGLHQPPGALEAAPDPGPGRTALALACPARDGAKELLAWLQERPVKILILSNHIEESIRSNLQRLDLLPHIDHISGNPHDNDIIRKMNKQERLNRFMKDHGFTADRAFIIGDSLEEPDIAKNLGLLSISITGGCISEGRLRKKRQDYLIDTLRDVQQILQKEWELEE